MNRGRYSAIVVLITIVSHITAQYYGSTNCGQRPRGYNNNVPPWGVIIRLGLLNPRIIHCIGALIKRSDMTDKSNLILVPFECAQQLYDLRAHSPRAYIGSNTDWVELEMPIQPSIWLSRCVIIQTRRFISFDQSAQPICLPDITDRHVPGNGHTIGLFTEGDGEAAKERRMQLVDHNHCDGAGYQPEKMFCAFDVDIGTTAGFASGPFYADRNNTGRATIFGFSLWKEDRVWLYDRLFPAQLYDYLAEFTRKNLLNHRLGMTRF